MKTKDIILKILEKNLKGVQLFRKEDVPQIIEKFDLIPCNRVELREDTLMLFFDDAIYMLELSWEQLGPRNTLIEINWKE